MKGTDSPPRDSTIMASSQPIAPSEPTKRNLAVIGVMLVIFLFAVDTTIVSTAMPTIVANLGGLELYSWVFSIYMLTSALTTPIFGKLADLFSRRRLMLTGIGIFLAGSLLCGAAPSMEALIVFRAVQGLGGGAIYALSFIVAGSLYPPERRAQVHGIISGIWGVASVLGPLAGGLIVEHWHWRWAFFVNLPITAVAVVLIATGLKEAGRERRTHKLDFAGTFALLFTLMFFFYALSRSAEAPAPLNAASLASAAVFCLLLFCLAERKAAEPIIPPELFRRRLFTTSTAVATLAAMGVFGAISYLPLYLQGVAGLTASHAGMILLFLSVAWTAGSLIAGQLLNRAGYRKVAVAGMALMAAGYSFFVAFTSDLSVPWVALSGTLIGLGMGMANLTTLVAVQNSVPRQRIGVATSTVMLSRTVGGAFAVSLLGTVLLNRMHRGLDQLAGGSIPDALFNKLADPQNLLEPSTRAAIPPELLPKLVAILGEAVWHAFLVGFLFMIAGVAAGFLLAAQPPAAKEGAKE